VLLVEITGCAGLAGITKIYAILHLPARSSVRLASQQPGAIDPRSPAILPRSLVLPGEHIQDCERDFNDRIPAVPPPYPLRVLLEDLIKGVLRLSLTRISRFTLSLSLSALTEHETIIVAVVARNSAAP
jgi:hypothetical protein